MYSCMIPLYKPYMPKVLPEIERILYSGALAYGKWGHQFEKRLSSFIGVENLLSTNSYASAIQMALTALDLQYGDDAAVQLRYGGGGRLHRSCGESSAERRHPHRRHLAARM